MKNLYWKNKNCHILFKDIEQKRIILKRIYTDLSLSKNLRLRAFFQFKTINKNSSITRLNNRCIFTNRSRSIYKKFKLSRLIFRQLALKGLLVGIKKSSW